VLVTHDARAAAYADRVLVVRDGSIRDEISLGRRRDHEARPLIVRLAALGL
jgi:ABC-type lipoprotein export system ATPase subunit